MGKEMLVRTTESGETMSLDKVRVYLKEKAPTWLTVHAPQGTNVRFPQNMSIGIIKQEIQALISDYKGKQLFLYDAAESFEETTVLCGGYEYLDDYVVQPGTLLYCSLIKENTAGESEPGRDIEDQLREWDGLTHVQIYDQEKRWEKVLLPDNLQNGEAVTISMLKRSVLARINMRATKEMMQNMRVFHCDSGIACGLPYKHTDVANPRRYYTVVLSPDVQVLVLTSGEEMPSPDSNADDIADWEDVLKAAQP